MDKNCYHTETAEEMVEVCGCCEHNFEHDDNYVVTYGTMAAWGWKAGIVVGMGGRGCWRNGDLEGMQND